MTFNFAIMSIFVKISYQEAYIFSYLFNILQRLEKICVFIG